MVESPADYLRIHDAEDTPGVPTPLRESSSRLLRGVSLTFTGGATVVPPRESNTSPSTRGDESTRRARALRRVSRSTVQQRMMEELWSRYKIRISLFIGTLVTFSFAIIILFFNALYAALSFHDRPCDMPLNKYLLISICIGQSTPQLVNHLQQQRWAQNPRVSVLISMTGSLPGWIVIAWGFWMIQTSKTCEITNPGLYYPTKHFILGQVILFVLTTVFFSFGFAGVLAYASTIADSLKPGCEQAVRTKLPKVPLTSPELRDDEDGESRECPICTDPFLRTSEAVVMTPCSHFFHEQCLARWCTNHLDCPLCRGPIGEATPRHEVSP